MKQNARWWAEAYIEKGIEMGSQEVREESISILMANLGWTRAQALEALSPKVDKQTTS